MYSTPGISQSSFSIGLVTRSSTSRADAPGICTKTSTIGTMICGSSSRGSFHTAKRADQQRARDDQRRQLGARSTRARTARPDRVRVPFTAGPPRWRRPPGRLGPATITFSPALKPGEHFDRARRRVCPVVIRRVRATPSSTTKTDCNWPRSDHGRRPESPATPRFPSWKRRAAEHARAERRAAAAGRS